MRNILLLKSNNYSISDLDMLIPHQANVRILNNVVEQLEIEPEKVVANVDRLGNTGCVSTGIGLSENLNKLEKGNLVCLTVFGGGYSSGAALLKV